MPVSGIVCARTLGRTTTLLRKLGSTKDARDGVDVRVRQPSGVEARLAEYQFPGLGPVGRLVELAGNERSGEPSVIVGDADAFQSNGTGGVLKDVTGCCRQSVDIDVRLGHEGNPTDQISLAERHGAATTPARSTRFSSARCTAPIPSGLGAPCLLTSASVVGPVGIEPTT
jgi:hypothetical protein